MKAPHLETSNPVLELVQPDVERDANLGVEWLKGELGRQTLASMGVPETQIAPTSLEAEKNESRILLLEKIN